MRKFGLLGVLLIGLLSVTLLQPVSAQEDIWCYEWDFTVSAWDWELIPDWDGTYYEPGVGWVSGTGTLTDSVFGTRAATGLMIQHDIPSGSDVTDIQFEYSGGTGINQTGVLMPANNPHTIIQRVGDASSRSPQEHLWEGDPINPGSVRLEIRNAEFGTTTPSGIISVARMQGLGENPFGENAEYCDDDPPPAGWVRPLLAEDEDTFIGPALVDGPEVLDLIGAEPLGPLDDFIVPGNQYRVTAKSIAPGAPVLAARSGTVKEIKIFAGDMCSLWGAVLTMGADCWFGRPNDPLNLIDIYSFPIDDTIQQVLIDIGDGHDLRYLVANANRYVNIGQTVEAGCVLGETIEARNLPIGNAANTIASIVSNFFGLSGFIEPGQSPGFGVSFVEERDPEQILPIVELLPKLTEYGNSSHPCNTAPEFQDCLIADSDLTNFPDKWEKLGAVQDTEAGLLLPPNTYIQQIVNLPDSTNFYLRVGLYFNLLDLVTSPEATTRQVTFRVGSFETTQVVPVDDSYQEFSIEVPEPDPDPGGLGYTVRISNISPHTAGSVIIAAACLTATDHELNPRACYFQNPEFDSTQGWVTTNVQQGNGFIILGNTDAILQEVTLDANEDDSPRTYRLEIDARPIAAPGTTLDTNAGSATLYYSWDGVETIGTLDLQWNLPGNPGYPDAYQTFSVDIEVAEHTSQDFTIYTGIVDNATVQIALSRACISTDTDTPTGGGVGGPFHTTCNTIPVPTEDSFGLWTMYHWRNLDKFFTCKLMVLLNKWFKLFDEFRRTMLLTARWWIAMANKAANWLSSVLFWLNGHFRNIAVGQVTIVNQGGGGAGIWDVLLAIINGILSPLLQIATKLFDLLVILVGTAAAILLAALVGIIALGVLFIAQILSLLTIGKDLLLVLINAFNATATVVPPVLPACQLDPQQHPLCVGLWVLENTIFSGTGAWLIPVIVSIGSIHLILWVIGDVKRTIMQMGRVV